MPVIERKVEETEYPFLGQLGSTQVYEIKGSFTQKGFVPDPEQKSPFDEHAAEMREYGRRMTQSMCGL